MIAAVIVLSLISLLVATDSEPEGTSVPFNPEPPLRVSRKVVSKPPVSGSDRIAA